MRSTSPISTSDAPRRGRLGPYRGIEVSRHPAGLGAKPHPDKLRQIPDTEVPMPRVALWFFALAPVYVLIGMSLGIYMGASEDHSLYPAHAHLNLIGWVTMA